MSRRCTNCGRSIYQGAGVPVAGRWCRCATFAPITDGPDVVADPDLLLFDVHPVSGALS